MDDQTKLALAAAVAGGYVLGRTKKGRFALTAATFVMGRSLEPRHLIIEGMRRLRALPQVAELNDQLKGEVFQAGRAAVTAAAERRLDSLIGSPHDDGPKTGAEDAEDDTDATRDETDETDDEDETDGNGSGDADERTGRGAARGKAPGKKAPASGRRTPTKKAPAKRAASARKAPAKKAPAKPAGRKAAGKPSSRSDRGR